MVDGDGVYSMPATYRWTDGAAGIDDDLVLDGVDFATADGTIAPGGPTSSPVHRST